MRKIGILGGTFNPIHMGHLRLAQELAEALNLDEVRFIPSANPPHKTAPTVSATHRANMVKLAIADNCLFSCDTQELNRSGDSYTIDTLASLRAALGNDVALCLIMGSDAFLKLSSWHQWQQLLNYCHIILVQRPSTTKQEKLADDLAQLLQDHYTENSDDLCEKSAGYIHMQAITPLAISSTNVRNILQKKLSVRYLVPEQVIEYIELNSLY